MLQFGFDASTQDPNVLIGFGLTTAVVVSDPATELSLQCAYAHIHPQARYFSLQCAPPMKGPKYCGSILWYQDRRLQMRGTMCRWR